MSLAFTLLIWLIYMIELGHDDTLILGKFNGSWLHAAIQVFPESSIFFFLRLIRRFSPRTPSRCFNAAFDEFGDYL